MPGLEPRGALAELTSGQIERLRPFLDERVFPDGTLLFRAEEESRELFWISEGTVLLSRSGKPEGAMAAGALLGALSLSIIGARQIDARTVGTTRVFVLDREAYLRMRMDDPELAMLVQEAIVRGLAHDLRSLFDTP
jgi:CRP-like cAMP-binding protein